MNKDMLWGLHPLPTRAVSGVDPWDPPLVEKDCQASLSSAYLG